MNARVTVTVMTLAVLGCGSDPTPPPPPMLVQWVDKNGRTWYAPPVTPEPGDPLFEGHPEPKVVLIDRATRRKVAVSDPTKFLQEQQQTGGPPRWLFVQKEQQPTRVSP